jgi:hypothetical protein
MIQQQQEKQEYEDAQYEVAVEQNRLQKKNK